MSRDQKNKVQAIVLLIILIAVIILAVKVFNKDDNKQEVNEQKIETSGIDFNSVAYEGKEIYEKDGDIIIEDENGKTIQTNKTKEDTGLKETTDAVKEKYEITDVKVSLRGGNTVITGKVKNNDKSDHKVIVNIKFYSEDNKIKGATSAKINVGKGQAKEFSMSIMDDVSKYNYKIQVEYTD